MERAELSEHESCGLEGAIEGREEANIKQETRGCAVDAEAQISRRFMPVLQLTPYETNWIIKVHVTRKGILRTYAKAHEQGHVFHVELADETNTAIQACMFDDAAVEFFEIFKVGKTYEISKGKVHPANKKFSRLKNDYELILNTNSIVREIKEANDDVNDNLDAKYNFVEIDHLQPYINTGAVVDVIGIVSNVSSAMSIRRKADNQEVAKREITIEDQSGRSIRVSLWGDLALKTGELLAGIVDQAPVISLTSIKTTDFLGISLSSTSDTIIEINPAIAPADMLHSWYDAHGKSMRCAPAGANLPRRPILLDSMTDRRFLSDVISIQSEKAVYCNVKASISYIDPEQTLWYNACKFRMKKVNQENNNFWCHTCQTNVISSKRYILFARLIDWTAEVAVNAFNDEAEKILGHTADDLYCLKCQDIEQKSYRAELKKATWMPKIFCLCASDNLYESRKTEGYNPSGNSSRLEQRKQSAPATYCESSNK